MVEKNSFHTCIDLNQWKDPFYIQVYIHGHESLGFQRFLWTVYVTLYKIFIFFSGALNTFIHFFWSVVSFLIYFDLNLISIMIIYKS